MKKISLSLSLLFVCIANMSYAQLEIGATIRPRTEYRNGFKKLIKTNENPALFTEQRTRIELKYSAEKFKIGMSFQDVRIWGETGQINKSDGLTSFHEAYFEYFFTKKFSLKGGRQELDYDDARILGNLDWAAQGRSHDGFVLKYTDSTGAVHVGATFNQNSTPVEPAKLTNNIYTSPTFAVQGGGLPNPLMMQYIWFQKSIKKFNVSALALNTGWQLASDSSINQLLTVGVNPAYKFSSKFGVDASFYYQAGKDRADKTTNAWMASLNMKYTGIKGVGLTLGGDYLTGTEKGNGRSTAFEPLFGTNHKFYGYMDYFYVGNGHAQGGRTLGLTDIYLKTKINVSKKSVLMADLHEFLSPVTVYESAASDVAVSSTLGTEIDLVYKINMAPAASVLFGYSQMFGTETMEIIKGGRMDKVNHWGWVMFVFKPSLAKL